MQTEHPDFYQTLAEALRARLSVIADTRLRDENPALHLEKLRDVSTRILQIQSQLPDNASPQLAHFLERCSYDKALAHITNDSVE